MQMQADNGKAEEYRKRIKHAYDPHYYQMRAAMLDRIGIPDWLFENIIAHGEENVRKIQDKQIVYTSDHVSMADYLCQGYLFWRDNLPIPRFLAGENLDRFILGDFFRKCGAMFIDRNEKDPLYWKVEEELVHELLLNGENFWFCPEGGRRKGEFSGELKTGTIGQIVDVAQTGREIWIEPVRNFYDKRIEENVIEEVRKNKQIRDSLLKESREYLRQGKSVKAFMAGLKSTLRDKLYFNLDLSAYFSRGFDRDKGNAYIYFGQPFSVQEFFSSFKGDHERVKKLALTKKIVDEMNSIKH